MIFPKFLKENSTIGVPAPSDGAYNETSIIRFKNAKKHFEEMGYKVIQSENLYKSKMARSAEAEVRGKELNEMFENPDIDMIICAAGGEFLLEVLPYVDFEKLVKNPKFVQGFSDPTGIMYPITSKYDIATIYSSNFKSFGMEPLYKNMLNNLEIIKGNIIEQNNFEKYEEEGLERVTGLEGYNLTEKVAWKVYNGSSAEFSGRLIGGCFENIAEIAGTKYDGGREFINRYKNDGIIWFFDACESSYETIIRNLWKFNELGYFDGNIKGIVFGRFGRTDTILGYDVESAIKDSVLGKLNIPIIYDADISHKGPCMTIISGSISNFKVEDGKAILKMELK